MTTACATTATYMCGVVGLMGSRTNAVSLAQEAFLGLTTLQHRGQDAAGILTYDRDGFHRVRNVGLVDSVFNRENMKPLTGYMALAHARYATIGRGEVSDVQPFLISYPYGIGLVHNGNVVNCAELTEELKESRRHMMTASDSEVILNLLAEGLEKATLTKDGKVEELSFEHICKAVESIHRRVNGSYSIIALIAGYGLIAFRDPLGLRPLVWGEREGTHLFASETVSLDFLGYKNIKDVKAGEVVSVRSFDQKPCQVQTKVLTQAPQKHCMFEWVYFSSPESIIDETPVYRARIQLGRALGKQIKKRIDESGLEIDLVVPVPESSRIAAIALSEEISVPYREVLIKNRYIKRTFILDSQEKRQKAVNLKLSPVRSEIQGKNVLLVDDSIVRGTTSKKIIELVRAAGAKSVYFVSTCPPIRFPCFYGIDFPESKELIAFGKTGPEIEKELSADGVIYQDLEGLKSALEPAQLCMACLDGAYPTDVSCGKRFETQRSKDRHTAEGEGA